MSDAKDFADICDALPEGVHWGDQLTVDIATSVWRAAQRAVLLQAARHTVPDREAVIEECAKVCDELSDESRWREAQELPRGNSLLAHQAIGACECAYRIRKLKAAPTGAEGEK